MLSEKQFQRLLIEFAVRQGWMWYHTFDSRGHVKGFPDLVLVRAPHVVFAELKSEYGYLRPEQKDWMSALQACQQVSAHTWKPSHYGEIVRMLT